MRQLFKLRRGSRRAVDRADSPAEPELEPTTPWPPRCRWLKRLSAAYLLFVTCLAFLYWGWTAYSHRQLDAAVAAVRARGEPALYEEFDPPPIPDERNAAAPLKEAARSFEPDAEWTRNLTQVPQHNLASSVRWLRLPQDVAVVDALAARHATTLRLVRKARARGEADWGVRVRKRMINILLPHLGGQRDLAQFLAAAAFARHARGADTEALQLCRDLLALGDHVGDNAPFGPVQAVSHGAVDRVADVVEQVAAELDLTDPTTRAAAQSLVAELLDERRMARNHLRTAQAERSFAADIFHGYLEGTGALTKPAMRIDAARALREREREVALARCASYADVVRLVPEVWPAWIGGPPAADTRRWRASFWRGYPPRLVRQTRVVSSMFRSPRRAAVPHYRARCDRRAAAALLAARMYQLDHDGQLPSKWADLVPAYLPSVPADPFAPGGAPLRLVRRYSDTIVYSVGKDLTDDGGAEVDARGLPTWRYQGNVAMDLVYHFRPPSPDDAQ